MGYSLYVAALEPGLLDRLPSCPSEKFRRCIGRPRGEQVREGCGIKIYWPSEHHGRIRRVLSRSGARRRYAVPCFRGEERSAHGEAEEEAIAAVLLDACFGVEFQEQPARIEFEWLGETVSHYPDALVVAGDVKEFWEFKRDREAADVYFRRRSERITELLSALGYGYRLIPRAALMWAWYYRNAIEMRRHAKLIAKHPRWMANLSVRMTGHGLQPAGIMLEFVPEEQRLAALHAFLYNGNLVTDLSRPVSLNSNVHPPRYTGGGLPWVWELLEKSS